ncbi:transcription initiation at TATA-containing promoter protein, partial [Coemansia sp. RSA 520]
MSPSDAQDVTGVVPMVIDTTSPEKIAAIAMREAKPAVIPTRTDDRDFNIDTTVAASVDSNGQQTQPTGSEPVEPAPAFTNGHTASANKRSDIDDEPAQKRMRTEDPPKVDELPKPVQSAVTVSEATTALTVTTTPAVATPVGNATETLVTAPFIMTKEQHKYCTAMVRALKRHRDSGPFLKPVDIVALNIPDYPNIVKHPMDMDTVEKTLKARQYTDTQAFSDDLRLMFNNCYMYNGRESVVGIMAGNIENMFESQLKKMPTGIDTALAEHNRRESEAGMRTPTSANRPKRDAHPPPSRDLPNMQRKKSRTTDPQMKHCLNIVKDFMKKANFNIAYPFLEPVDPIGMNCPDYFS